MNFRSKTISIHALREEGDENKVQENSTKLIFLSTPSARRATGNLSNLAAYHLISIHALREEGDLIVPTKINLQAISIHALREEGDAC